MPNGFEASKITTSPSIRSMELTQRLLEVPGERRSWWSKQACFSWAPTGGFLKWWYPTTMGFPTKNDHFGVFWGYHHLRKHPTSFTSRILWMYSERPVATLLWNLIVVWWNRMKLLLDSFMFRDSSFFLFVARTFSRKVFWRTWDLVKL